MQQNLVSLREHRELGDVAWLRDLDAGLAVAAEQRKPVLLLFQEVPGCSTCVNYGRDSLSHPLMVELIEQHFVPLAIFNNHPGDDARILSKFGEAAWNNPVAYVLDSEGTPLLPRLANRYGGLDLHRYLAAALERLGIVVPGYFSLLGGDLALAEDRAQTATFETPCFWSGETSLAQFVGVISTDAGWVGGEEVVQVRFDPTHLPPQELVEYARKEGFRAVGNAGFSLDKDPQFYLKKHKARHLPLTAAQRTRLNVAIPYGDAIDEFLSPHQRAWLADDRLTQVSANDAYRQDFSTTWHQLDRALPARTKGS